METINVWQINGTEYELYRAASGDYCVSVSEYGNRDDYNLGSIEDAYEFILNDYEVPFEKEDDEEV